MSFDTRQIPTAAVAGVAAAVLGIVVLKASSGRSKAPTSPRPQDKPKRKGGFQRWSRPVVLASPCFSELAANLRKRLGAEEFTEAQGPTISSDFIHAKDRILKFNWQRLLNRKVIFLFDTVDESALFDQIALLHALQGFPVPDGDEKGGKYSWGRAAHIVVILPWYRHCQLQRTRRWSLANGQWSQGDPQGQWLDVPKALFLARLLSTPGTLPPAPGPTQALDGMPLSPLWRPPVELVFMDLHEEASVRHALSDQSTTARMERFVPYFLDKFKAAAGYEGKARTYVVFPNSGVYERYAEAVAQRLRLDADHILYVQTTPAPLSAKQEEPDVEQLRELQRRRVAEEYDLTATDSPRGAHANLRQPGSRRSSSSNHEVMVPKGSEVYHCQLDGVVPEVYQCELEGADGEEEVGVRSYDGRFELDNAASQAAAAAEEHDEQEVAAMAQELEQQLVRESVWLERRLLFEEGEERDIGEKQEFERGDSILIVDDFINTGRTIFTIVEFVRKLAEGNGGGHGLYITLFAPHFVATYHPEVVEGLKAHLFALGPRVRLVTTNTIPLTTDQISMHPQVEVLDVSDFLADVVH